MVGSPKSAACRASTSWAACSIAETASRGRLPCPGRPSDGQHGLQQTPLGHAELQVGRLGDQAGVALDQALLEQGAGAEPAARSSSATRWNTTSQAGAWPARSRVARAQMAAAMPPFMSALPRP